MTNEHIISEYLGSDVTCATINPFNHAELIRSTKLHLSREDFEKYVIMHPLVQPTPFKDSYVKILYKMGLNRKNQDNIFSLDDEGFLQEPVKTFEINFKGLTFKIYYRDIKPYIGE